MRFVFLTSIMDTVIAINPDNISHIDNAVEGHKPLLGSSIVILKTNMFLKVKGNPKDVANVIMKQTEEILI